MTAPIPKPTLLFSCVLTIVILYDDYKKITEDQECLLKEQAVLPSSKEEFDAGVDVVERYDEE
jgi:hypothetical protein